MKLALHELADADLIDIEEDATKFCVSTVTRNVAHNAILRFTRAWNEHSIPNLGIPSQLFAQRCRTSLLPQDTLPPGIVVANEYNDLGGNITLEGKFGQDPLQYHPYLINERSTRFQRDYPDPNLLFSTCVNRNRVPFKNAVLRFVELTYNLTP